MVLQANLAKPIQLIRYFLRNQQPYTKLKLVCRFFGIKQSQKRKRREVNQNMIFILKYCQKSWCKIPLDLGSRFLDFGLPSHDVTCGQESLDLPPTVSGTFESIIFRPSRERWDMFSRSLEGKSLHVDFSQF